MKSMNTFDCDEFQVQTLGDTISLTMFYILLYFITIIYKLYPSLSSVEDRVLISQKAFSNRA